MKITFLGTSSMVPTIERNHTSILISYKSENIMVDCGEGTQRQLRHAKISPCKITKLLITHWHGDHILGIPGLIQSMGANNCKGPLDIYGPKGTIKYFENMFKWFSFPLRIKVNVYEVDNKKFFENEDFSLITYKMDHDVPCNAYSIEEKDKRNINVDYIKKFGLKQHPILKDLQKGKNIVWGGKKIFADKATKIKKGKKVTIVLDTAYNENAVKASKNADVLVCESTWMNELEDKNSGLKHLTTKQAGTIAKKAKVKQLIITHFSQRYKDEKILEKEVKKTFKNTISAKDFFVYSV